MNLPLKWGDAHQYVAAPMEVDRTKTGAIIPKVHLLSMTPDPLGAVAALSRMYEGKPTYNLSEITDEERRKYFDDMQKTHLQAPLEAIKFHFFFEGVTRSFTHQLVRQRTAVYAQESLRFAVKEGNWEEVVSLPPSLANVEPSLEAGLDKSQQQRFVWDEMVRELEQAYQYLVNSGMPAEEARGLMPHAMTTRVHFVTDLRNLIAHAGNRLCTQAQFEWRIVFMGIVNAIRDYMPDFSWFRGMADAHPIDQWADSMRWQQLAIADSALFRPACYQLGHCPFKASFDRSCTIRDRVDKFAKAGIPSEGWHSDGWCSADRTPLDGISNDEWMMDPAAARLVSGGGFD